MMITLANFIGKLNISERNQILRHLKKEKGDDIAAAFALYCNENSSDADLKQNLGLSYKELWEQKSLIRDELARFYRIKASSKKQELLRDLENIPLMMRVKSAKKMKIILHKLAEDLKAERLHYYLPEVYRYLQFYSLSKSSTAKFRRLNGKKIMYRDGELAVSNAKNSFVKLNKLISNWFLNGGELDVKTVKMQYGNLKQLASDFENPYTLVFEALAAETIKKLCSIKITPYGKFSQNEIRSLIEEVPELLCRYYFNNILELLDLLEKIKSPNEIEVIDPDIRFHDVLANNFSFPGGILLSFLIDRVEEKGEYKYLRDVHCENIRAFIPSKKNSFSFINFYLFKAIVSIKGGQNIIGEEALMKVYNFKKLSSPLKEDMEKFFRVFNNENKHALKDKEGQYSFFTFSAARENLVNRYLRSLETA